MTFVWWGYYNQNLDSYPEGEAWLFNGEEWVTEGFVIKDWCFKTYGFHRSQSPRIPETPVGNVEGYSWNEYMYTTMTTDPEGDEISYGWDWDGDNVVDEWTGLYGSGEIVNRSHFWKHSGTYFIQVKAKDQFGSISNFSSKLKVTISNDPPNNPSIPSGITVGLTNQEYWYSTNATDPEGDEISYGWDWDGDDVVDEWTDLYASGEKINVSHIWQTSGTFYVQVKAKDDKSAESFFSDFLRVIVVSMDNDPPNKPLRPTGTKFGRTRISHSFSTMATDPDDDLLWYLWDWGDGSTSDWIGPFESGQFCNVSHSWEKAGSFQVKVKARDADGEESVWSDTLPVRMPKNIFFFSSFSHFLSRVISFRINFDQESFIVEWLM